MDDHSPLIQSNTSNLPYPRRAVAYPTPRSPAARPIPVYDACPSGFTTPDPIPRLRVLIPALAITLAVLFWGAPVASLLIQQFARGL